MHTLLYLPSETITGQRLHYAVENSLPKKNIETYHTILELIERFAHPTKNNTVAVLLAETKQHLNDILVIRDILSDVRTILVIPDIEDDTIANAHKLRPRYIRTVRSDFTDISAVLSKMEQNLKQTQHP